MNKFILYFTADWCGPCQRIKPLLKELKNEYHDIKVITIDVDATENEEVVNKFKVSQMPTFIALSNKSDMDNFKGTCARQIHTDLLTIDTKQEFKFSGADETALKDMFQKLDKK